MIQFNYRHGFAEQLSGASRSVVVAVVSIVLLITSITVSGQSFYYQAYDRGIKAYEAGNLPLARQMFERALQLDSRQARNKNLGGTFFGAYLPDYYLGLIAVQEKRYDEALGHFDRLRTLNLVGPRDKEYGSLTAQRTIAEEAVKTAALARPSAPTAGPAAAPGPSPPPELPKPSAPAQATETPRQPGAPADTRGNPTTIARAEEPPAAPLPSPRPPASPPAAAAATTAAAEVEGLSSTISRDVDRGEFERAWDGVQHLAAMPGGAAAARSFANRIRAAIPAAGESRLNANDVEAAGRLSNLLTRIAPGSPEARRLQQRVDARMRDAQLERDTLKMLLLGQYQKVIDLTGARIGDDLPSARLLFFAACGQAALSLTLPADARARPIAAARELFGRAAGMGASFSREEQYISPEILAVPQTPLNRRRAPACFGCSRWR